MITPAQHAEIRRLYYGEHWTVGTVAAQLGVHHETVRAALAETRVVRRGACRRTHLDPSRLADRLSPAVPKIASSRQLAAVIALAAGLAAELVSARTVEARVAGPKASRGMERTLSQDGGRGCHSEVDLGL